MLRTHTCGDLRDSDIDSEITLAGWVHRRRDHGGLVFIDLRDRYGLTQVVADPADSSDAHAVFEKLRPEWVVRVSGRVRARPAGQENPKMETGMIELLVSSAEIFSEAKTPPFEIDSDAPVGEDVRLKYRYLDLRRERMTKNLKLRHEMVRTIRDFFANEDFIDVETPVMVKGTPEGSREYLVPSRLHPG